MPKWSVDKESRNYLFVFLSPKIKEWNSLGEWQVTGIFCSNTEGPIWSDVSSADHEHIMNIVVLQSVCPVADQSWDGAEDMNNAVYSNSSLLSEHLSKKGRNYYYYYYYY
jgi:hypothetical protein